MYEYPKRGKSLEILKHLHANKPMTTKEIIEMFKVSKGAVQSLVHRGYATRTGNNRITVTRRIAAYLDNGCKRPDTESTPARGLFKGNGFVPQYMKCLRTDVPEWAKRDEFSKVLA